MKLWAARNNNGTLEIHQTEPSITKVTGIPMWVSGGFVGFIDDDNFPELTFENSPVQVELKLIGK